MTSEEIPGTGAVPKYFLKFTCLVRVSQTCLGAKNLGVVLPHLPVGKKSLRFCLV